MSVMIFTECLDELVISCSRSDEQKKSACHQDFQCAGRNTSAIILFFFLHSFWIKKRSVDSSGAAREGGRKMSTWNYRCKVTRFSLNLTPWKGSQVWTSVFSSLFSSLSLFSPDQSDVKLRDDFFSIQRTKEMKMRWVGLTWVSTFGSFFVETLLSFPSSSPAVLFSTHRSVRAMCDACFSEKAREEECQWRPSRVAGAVIAFKSFIIPSNSRVSSSFAFDLIHCNSV